MKYLSAPFLNVGDPTTMPVVRSVSDPTHHGALMTAIHDAVAQGPISIEKLRDVLYGGDWYGLYNIDAVEMCRRLGFIVRIDVYHPNEASTIAAPVPAPRARWFERIDLEGARIAYQYAEAVSMGGHGLHHTMVSMGCATKMAQWQKSWRAAKTTNIDLSVLDMRGSVRDRGRRLAALVRSQAWVGGIDVVAGATVVEKISADPHYYDHLGGPLGLLSSEDSVGWGTDLRALLVSLSLSGGS